uniref:Outer membrane protein transport protein n=1 Tax=Roseihalotalea indica TaxID=2867963 RepID=A0AA49GIH7_9BACT|nr:outer membrane protein transport protein [Tunicatimonas sp. TK19036]
MNIYKYKSLIAFGLFLFSVPAFSQIAEDALMLGQSTVTGTARFQAIGGAGFALGGDASAAALNPAGLGFYNRSSVVLTPGFDILNTSTDYLGTSADAFTTRGNIANFGIVINNTKDGLIPSDWRGGSFAVTYNRLNSLNFESEYGPGNSDASIIDEFVLQANGIPSSELQANIDDGQIIGYPEAAYLNFLINPDASGNNYIASIPADATTIQSGNLSTSGQLSQWNFAYGGNYKDKLYLGASIGFRGFSYQRESEYREEVVYSQDYIDFINEGNYFFPVEGGNVSVDYVNYNQLNEVVQINGTGINANLGIIYRPINELTVGLSYQSPTFYSIRSEETFDLASEVLGFLETDNPADAIDIYTDDPVLGNRFVNEYTLSTPSRTGVGLAYFFEKAGFLTLDAEYVNYQKNQFSSNQESLSDVNNNVDAIYKPVINTRVGGEFRYNILRFRAGYAFYDDPTQFANDNLDRDRSVISGGIGINVNSFFADLTVSHTQYQSDFAPYANGPYIPQENTITRTLLSLGFNF